MSSLPADWRTAHDGRIAAMIAIADAAGKSTLEHFDRSDLTIDRKADDSPVTIADRNAEKLTRELIAQQFADDAVDGEEMANTGGRSGYRWTVDPIDGTKSFICGVPLYSTLLALEHGDEVVGGVIGLPALGKMLVAMAGGGCFETADGEHWKAARVSQCDTLAEAVYVTSEVAKYADTGYGGAYQKLQDTCWQTRTWGDGFGYYLVATGKVELMVDPICSVWDVAPMVPILTEAGGRFTDWRGNATIRGGVGLGTNGRVHQAALAMLVPDQRP